MESTTSWENSGLSLVGQEQTVAEAGSCSVPCKQGAQTALCSIQPCCAWVTSSTLKYNHLPYLSSLGVKACFATFVYLYFRPFSITQGNDCSFSFAKLSRAAVLAKAVSSTGWLGTMRRASAASTKQRAFSVGLLQQHFQPACICTLLFECLQVAMDNQRLLDCLTEQNPTIVCMMVRPSVFGVLVRVLIWQDLPANWLSQTWVF